MPANELEKRKKGDSYGESIAHNRKECSQEINRASQILVPQVGQSTSASRNWGRNHFSGNGRSQAGGSTESGRARALSAVVCVVLIADQAAFISTAQNGRVGLTTK